VDPRIADLAQRFWDGLMRISPQTATVYGDHRFDHMLGDRSEAGLADAMSFLEGVATDAEAIPDDGLTKSDRITRAMLISESRGFAIETDPIALQIGIDPLTGVVSALISVAAQTQIDDPDDTPALLERYSQVGRYLEESLDWHRRGLSVGRVAPGTNIGRVLEQIDAYLASPVEQDPFVNIGLPSWDGEAQWRKDMTDLVESHVRPAFAKYRHGLADELLEHGRSDDKPGLLWVEGGAEYYEKLIERYTTLHESADSIHAYGLFEIEDHLLEELRRYGESALGTPDTRQLFDRLRTDESLRFADKESLIAFNEAVIARAEAAIPDWFGRLPQAACQMAEIPAALAPNMPPAYYYPPPADGSRPGTYFINTADAPSMQTFDMEAVAFHEAVPGHHLQCAINAEAGDLPMFRRYNLIYAYAEGWGLYAERLADEMGLYTSDLERIGMASADAWRCARLVVDTGIHAKGWSRQQAIDFIMNHTPIKESTVKQEVDRYIGYPGQALAYKIGQREIFRLRKQAEDRLGDRFDIRTFHDALLTSGAMPLPMLDTLITEWIEATAA